MLRQNQMSRLSKIGDHNIYQNTDTLYQPLRKVLRKSMVSNTFLSSPNKQINLESSRIAKRQRIFSPAEAEVIKRNIFIPINKQLVASNNFKAVQGKTFVAVDMQQKVGEPITPEQFSRIKTNRVEKIVYQINGEPASSQSIYTTQFLRSFNQPQELSRVNSGLIQRRQIQVQPLNNPKQTTMTFKGQTVNFQQSHVLPVQNHRISMPTNPTFSSNTHLRSSNFTELRTVNKPQTVVVHQQNTSPSPAPSRMMSIVPQPLQRVKSYDFKQSIVTGQSSLINSRHIKKQQDYKYNLFSVVDQGFNNNCQNGCFGSNEVIAPRISNSAWK